ncbi:kinesin motor domain protein [Opisthorchis viverrini]|uniref:Kinesin motor domain protein n=1 Tax=Opisthorchis viverrini TaxID=6198 RepID=A0A1S8WUD8_OPIVI|nr:kinesin motor domain protein [Opisthorchis viverrini]
MDTSVKVGVRVRPLSEAEVNDGCVSCLAYPAEPGHIMIGRDKLFSFDYVFDEAASQCDIYTRAAEPMVDTVLKGYNATLLAYGQTGSGKTYSMGTCALLSPTDPENGIVPRMVQDIFRRIPSLPFDYTIRVSFLEIYKEDIHDLLSEDVNIPLPIREENQIIKIPGLTESVVNSCEDVLALLQSGSTKRSVGGTAMNRHSSRSHAVFTLHFVIRPREEALNAVGSDDIPTTVSKTPTTQPDQSAEGETLTAKLHLVDLAGSERQKKTHAEGDRLKEGININRGLLALGNVISALCEKDAKKRSHIPYRDSRLTRLLQDSLGGNSMTFMLACVSPADSNMEETLSTLRYADRARLIKNKPILNRADPKDAELARLRSMIAQLQNRLAKGSAGLTLMSPCAPKLQSSASTFSTTIISSLNDRLAKSEDEKQILADQLDKTLEESAELYKKLFDAEAIHDAVFAELDRLNLAISSIDPKLAEAMASDSLIAEFVRTVKETLTTLYSMKDTKHAELIISKVDELYENCSAILKDSSSVGDSPEIEKTVGTNGTPLSDAQDHLVTRTQSNVTKTSDRRGSEIRARRLACKERMDSIKASIEQKHALLESLERAANQGEESYASLIEQYEAQVRDLESRITTLEQERKKLLSERMKTGDESKEQRLKAMERELCQVRHQLADLSRLRKAKEARESECLRLRNDIQTLKVSMVRTAKQLKDESAAYRKWRIEKESEVRRLQEHDRRLRSEMSQMASTYERQHAVLKRRVEAAAATERRLKEVLMLQRDRREKRMTENTTLMSKQDLAARVRSWVNADLDVQVSMGEARYHLGQLIESRRTLCEQLRSEETMLMVASDTQEPSREKRANNVSRLTEAIELQTQQITDLQQKLMDAGERVSNEPSSSNGAASVDQMLSARLAQLHNIQEARIAIRYLFKEVSSFDRLLGTCQVVASLFISHHLIFLLSISKAASCKVDKLVSDSRLSDLVLQMTSKEEETDQLRTRAAEYSMNLASVEEQCKALRGRILALESDNAALRSQLDELKQAVESKPTRSQVQSYIIDSAGEVRRLSGTPVFSQKRRITRRSVQAMRKKSRAASPRLLVPDSTKKTESVWSVFDEDEEPPSDSSVVDPTWRLSDVSEEETPVVPHVSRRTLLNETKIGSRVSQLLPRCTCRGSCTNRCSCHRAGRQAKLEPITERMPPPTTPPMPSKRNRKRSQRPPLNELKSNHIPDENDEPDILNKTFDLGREENHVSPLKTSSVVLTDINSKYLWPKTRLSYFPSPSLRPDV